MNSTTVAQDIINILKKYDYELDAETTKHTIIELENYLWFMCHHKMLGVCNEEDTEKEIETHYTHFIECLKDKRSDLLSPRTELESALLQIDTAISKLAEQSNFDLIKNYRVSLVCAVIFMIDTKLGRMGPDIPYDNKTYYDLYSLTNRNVISFAGWNQLEVKLLKILGVIDIIDSRPSASSAGSLMVHRYKRTSVNFDRAHPSSYQRPHRLTWS